MARAPSNIVYLESPEKGVDGRGILTLARDPVISDGRIGDFIIQSVTKKLYGPKNAGGWPDLGLIRGAQGWAPKLVAEADGTRRVFKISDWTGGEGAKPDTGYLAGDGSVVPDIEDATDFRGEQGPQALIDDLDPAATPLTDASLAATAEVGDDNVKRSVVEVFDIGGAIDRLTVAHAQASSIRKAVGVIRIQDSVFLRVPAEPNLPSDEKFRSLDRWTDEGNHDSANGGWWQRLLPFFVDADKYGVPGTTAALLKAIAVCKARGGGTVIVSPRTWTISQKIDIPSCVHIRGAGIDATIFKAANGLNNHMFSTPDTETLWGTSSESGAQYWSIAECTVDGNKAFNTSGCGIRTYSRAYVLKNVKIVNCAEKGLMSRWGDAAAWEDDDDRANDPFMEALLDNLFVGYCNQEGIYYDGPHDGRMRECLVALNSHASPGTYDGLYIGPRAGGHMATGCHSWGDTQRYGYNIEAASTHFGNCEADAAAIALVRINSEDCTWVGGTQIGGWIYDPPSAANKNLKGFVFGPSAFRPFIVCAVNNTPKGVIDFENLGNFGGSITIIGSLALSLQTGSTGESTFGFQNIPPSSVSVNLTTIGFSANGSVINFVSPVSFPDGTAGFPSVRPRTDITTGLFFGTNFAGLSVRGLEAFRALRDNCVRIAPRSAPPVNEPWVEGNIYYDSSLHKLRVFDGTAWQNCW